jgi:CheY-like chemotaxis protein
MNTKSIQKSSGPWVLVVEDDADLRLSTLMIVQDENINAIGASDGVDAIRVMSVALHEDHMPFIVFLDLNMPTLTGQEILYWLEVAQPKIKNIPIVVTTGEKAPHLQPNQRLLRKPYSVTDIIDEIKRVQVQ